MKFDLSDIPTEDLATELMRRSSCGVICLRTEVERNGETQYEYFRQWMGDLHLCIGLMHNAMFNMELDLIYGDEEEDDDPDEDDDSDELDVYNLDEDDQDANE